MKAVRNESSKKLVCVAAWFLVPLLVLVVLKTDSLPQLTRLREASITRVSDFFRPSGQVPLSKFDGKTSNQVDNPSGNKENVVESGTQVLDETVHRASSSDSVVEAPPSPASSAGGGVDAIKDVAAPRSKLSCNLSDHRMDLCSMEGDIRMLGKSATIYVVAASDDSYRPENGTVRIHPYARKWEAPTMKKVREVSIRPVVTADDAALVPRCTVMHDVPAVVFSTTSAYSKNFFHAVDDTIIPLYNTAREYDGHVHLVATDYNHEWVYRYRHILAALSLYPVIDFDADQAVRCFPAVQVGVQKHDQFSVIPALSRKGYTMMDFREFLRSAYSLKREWATPANRTSGQKPRLVIVLRGRSRAITNQAAAIATATEVGFEVVTAGLEMVRDMAVFTAVVNSCDVMLGVHGAGLTNLFFLPNNGTLMQIIPWGKMQVIGFHEFGLPLKDMGLRYVQYEVTAEETTLKDVYPKDHAVFADPLSIHKQGWDSVWGIFLNGQNVTLDIDRFREAMQQVYQSVTIT